MKYCQMNLLHRFLLLPLVLFLFVLPICTGGHESMAAVGDIVTIAGGGAGDGGPAISAPISAYSVFWDNSGNIYIADTYSHEIRKVNGQGGTITKIAGIGSAGFYGDGDVATNAALNYPRDVYVDPYGIIYIADSGNNRIRKISADGRIATIAGNGNAGYSGDGGEATAASLNRPFGITGDANGNIYFSDYGNHCVRKIDTNGIISTFAGNGIAGYSGDGGPATSAMLYSPVGLAVDSSGNVYIAAVNNHAIRKVNTLGVISTFAGNGTPGSTGDGGPATSAYIPAPVGISFDAAGAMYIADSSDNRIRKVGTNGIITTVAGTGLVGYSGDGAAAVSATLNHPTGVSADSLGGFCIADGYNNRIRCVSPGGVIATVAGSGAFFHGDGLSAVSASLAGPAGISVDTSGAVIITDKANARVRKIDSSGIITTIAGNGTIGFSGDGGPATLAKLSNYSYGITRDTAGKLYIADAFNSRIRKIDLSGVIATVAGNGAFGYNGDFWAVATSASLNQPLGVVADASGNIFIADTNNNRIRKVAANGSISTVAGTGTAGFSGDGGAAVSASLNLPIAVALDSAGNLLITDRGNHRIRKVNGMGIISTIAGNGITGYSGDGGAASSASLNYPGGIALDGQGNIYIADTTNHRVRKIDGTGVITTIAGNGSSGYSGDAGPATEASLYSPEAVFVDTDGNLLIADTSNNRIRKVVSSGVTGAIKINDGAAYTVTAAVSLNLSCVSAAGSCIEMQFSPDGVDWSAPVEGFSVVKAWTLSSEEGVKNVYVKFKDDANNWSSAYRATIALDAFPPTVIITSPQQGTINDNRPTILYTVSDGTVTVKVDGVTVNKVSGNSLDMLSEGTHTLRVESKDVSGKIGFDEVVFTVDTPPTVTITAPTAGITNSTTPLLTYSVSNGTVVVTVDGVAVSIVYGGTLGPLTDGTHTVRVEATDASGTGFAEQTFTVDTVAPTVSLTSPTTGTTTDNQPLLTYTVSDGTVTVKVDGVAVSTVSGSRLAVLANGTHTVRVESRDAAGNTGFAEVTFTVNAPIISTEDFETGTLIRLPWVTSGNGLWAAKTTTKHGGSYSAEAPVSIIDSQSAGMEVSIPCTSGNISFWYSVSSEANYDYLTFYVDGVQKGRWSGTVSWTQATFPVTAGTHVFKWVYSKDSSVSTGSDTAWVDDIVFPVYIPVPTVTISSPSAGVTNNNRPVLTYSVSDGSVVVKVDGVVVSKVSGDSLDALADGQHTVRVEATNGGGTGFAQTTFTVDTTVPSVGFNPVTSPTSASSQTVTGTRESNATITVTADTTAQTGAVNYPTSTTWSVGVTGLVEGANTFTFTATDGANNSTSSTVTITLDTVAPQVSISSPLTGITNSSTPVLTYSLTEGTATVTVDGIVVTKASGDTLGPLADGPHTIKVGAVDMAGNSGYEEVTFTVDATAPMVTITSPTVSITSNATPTLSFTLSEGAAVVTVDGAVLPLNSGDTLARLADGPHNVRVSSVDAAGNSGYAEVSFTVDTLASDVSISSPVSAIGNNKAPILNFSASEGTIVVKVDGTVVAKTSGDTLDPLADGLHVVRVEATDSANNFAFAETSFTIDTVVPAVTITSPAAGPTGLSPVLAFTASEGAVSVKVDGVVVNKVSGEMLDALPVGSHLVVVEATDAAGNVGFAQVSFSVESYTVTLNAGFNGSISGPGAVIYGDKPTYSFLPDTGYHVADVIINGASVGAVSSYPFTAGVTANTVIEAVFAIDTFSVTMSGDVNGVVTGPASVDYGGSAGYTITPVMGYHVADAMVDGVSVGAISSYTFSNVTADHTISATFAINNYSISATAGANGSIIGPGSMSYGGSADYTITPATGYHVADVLVDGVSVSAVSSYTFSNVTADHTINATFAINNYNISATAGANGLIAGPASVNYGGSASFTISPASGYQVADVLVDGVSVGVVSNYTFSGVTTDHTISATFVPSADLTVNSVTAPANANRGNSISVSTSIGNLGGPAGSFTAAFYLSKDAIVNGSDILLGTKTITSLTGGSTTTVSGSFTVPAGIATGKYYIGAIVDPDSVIAESKENNNSKAAGNTTNIK